MAFASLLWIVPVAASPQSQTPRSDLPQPASAAGTSQAATLIPFTTAWVHSEDGKQWRINWSGTGIHSVRIYAGQEPVISTTGRPVGHGGRTGAVDVKNLPAAARWYFTLVPDRGSPLVIADRSLHLPSAPNFRDLGGYRTSDGQWVRAGLLYRSDQLDLLTDADLAVVQGLGLKTVVDLRTATERAHGPDRVLAGVETVALDVMADKAGASDARQTMARLKTSPTAAVDILTDANRDFVSSGSGRRSYADLMHLMGTRPEDPKVFHCTAGKDRTGWAAAVLLTALGVPRETVIADYLESNELLAAKNQGLLTQIATKDPSVDQGQLKTLLGVQRQFIEEAFAEVDRQYGSFENYLYVQLGVTPDELAALRRQHLVGAPIASAPPKM
jgi:protein-tyrosine phosphatase